MSKSLKINYLHCLKQYNETFSDDNFDCLMIDLSFRKDISVDFDSKHLLRTAHKLYGNMAL